MTRPNDQARILCGSCGYHAASTREMTDHLRISHPKPNEQGEFRKQLHRLIIENRDENSDIALRDQLGMADEIMELFAAHQTTRTAELVRLLEAEKRDQYYGMGECRDLSHCVPGYVDIESVDWWNAALDTAVGILKEEK